jgi:hypothetical protein
MGFDHPYRDRANRCGCFGSFLRDSDRALFLQSNPILALACRTDASHHTDFSLDNQILITAIPGTSLGNLVASQFGPQFLNYGLFPGAMVIRCTIYKLWSGRRDERKILRFDDTSRARPEWSCLTHPFTKIYVQASDP